jgi:poly(A) polymerase
LISGDDLIALGYRPGPIFKEILKAVEDAQLDLLIHNRAQALNWVESQFERKAASSGTCNKA